ncbi:branched-chain amino acid ABC transporter permease [Kallotenue papyrolyticum]|uniref:branched-chain amino acid ABC transporter permease n=1 Tax=Kallotenue papyrolyticum TaxID=1325125 RepID=UPI0004785B90|nr:hypothetical protein [Kallotenue papyrolyticum]
MGINLRSVGQVGLVGALASWHVCLVGMLETFAARQLVGGALTLGYVLLLAILLVSGYVAAQRAKHLAGRLVSGLLAGLIVGLALALLAVITASFDLRSMFVFASPRLVQLLTFERGLGALYAPILSSALVGLLGAALALVPPLWRRIITLSLTLTLLIALLRDIVTLIVPDAWERGLFTRTGLTLLGALITMVLVGALLYLRAHLERPRGLPTRAPAAVARLALWRRYVLLVLAALALLTFPRWGGLFLSNVAAFVGLFIIMGLGLNLVVGFAGLLDLGYVGFYAIGAYTVAILTSPEMGIGLDFWVALPIAMLAAMISGAILALPVLRMRGDYLAITTLGFGEIIRILLVSDALRGYLGGAQGITRIDQPQIGELVIRGPQQFYYLILIGCVIAWFVAARLKTSRIGRAWMAIREDEDVAQAMGINRVSAKLLAFVIGALLGGMAGAFFASLLGSVVPRSFDLLVSINVLALLIIGGMGSLPGVVVGALVLVGLPELLREFAEYRLLVYGIVLVIMMIYRPEGLLPEARRAMELHEGEEQDLAAELPAAVPTAEPPRKAGTPPAQLGS